MTSLEYWDVDRIYFLDVSNNVIATHLPFSSAFFGQPAKVVEKGKHGFSHDNAFVASEAHWGGRASKHGGSFYIGSSVDVFGEPPAKLLLVQSSKHRANAVVVEAYDDDEGKWVEIARTSHNEKLPDQAIVEFSKCVNLADTVMQPAVEDIAPLAAATALEDGKHDANLVASNPISVLSLSLSSL